MDVGEGYYSAPTITAEPLAVRDPARGQWRHERMLRLQDGIRSARRIERLGTNGAVLSGILWLVSWRESGMGYDPNSWDSPAYVVPVAVLLLASGAGCIEALLRRRSALVSARKLDFVLRDPGAAPPRWRVRRAWYGPESEAATEVGVVERADASPERARLNEGLAADRRHRTVLAHHFQRLFDRAASLEAVGRRGCLATAVVAMGIWPCVLVAGIGQPAGDPLPMLLMLPLLGVAVSLPLCASLALAGNGWRRWLLWAARREALEVERIQESSGSTTELPGIPDRIRG